MADDTNATGATGATGAAQPTPAAPTAAAEPAVHDADAAAADAEAKRVAELVQQDLQDPRTIAMFKGFVRQNIGWIKKELDLRTTGMTAEERAKANP